MECELKMFKNCRKNLLAQKKALPLPDIVIKTIHMYVIVEIAGQQFKAEKGRKLYVHRLKEEVGTSVSFDKVLLTENDGQVKVGTPVVEGASVSAKILKHLKDDKVLVFKKKRRKGYQTLNGHRQYLTQIVIEEIVA
jgi:large subunit ribosomal protein L21